MSKEVVEILKRNHKDSIIKKSNKAETGVIIYNDTAFSDYCFARMFRKIREHHHTFKTFYYLLYFNRNSDLFDYNALHKELNKLFGQYFKIIRYFSGKKNVRILSFEVKKKVPHWKLWWYMIYIASCMLRLTDQTFENDWKKYFKKSGRKKPINNWKDLIYLFHRYIYAYTPYYELNDELVSLGRYLRTGSDKDNELKKAVQDYLITLHEVFGKQFTITKPMISYIASCSVQHQYQSRVYDAIKHVKELAND
jgi:hypothetical protein